MAKHHKTASSDSNASSSSSALDSAGEKVDLFHLALQATPELIAFQGIVVLVDAVALFLLQKVSDLLIKSGGVAITSANVLSILSSWQGILLVIIGLATIAITVTVEIFACVFFCEGILQGDQRAILKRTGEAVNRALTTLPKFLSLSGLLALFYIAFLAPLVGVGFSTFLTSHVYIPTHIMEVINRTPLYRTLYVIVMVLLAVMGFVYCFSLHAILLDDLRPMEAYKCSRVLVRRHWRDVVLGLLKMLGATLVCALAVVAIFFGAYWVLEKCGAGLPVGYVLDSAAVLRGEIPWHEVNFTVVGYRALCLFVFFIVAYLLSALALLIASYTMLVLTHLYDWFRDETSEEAPRYLRRGIRHSGRLKLVELLGVGVILGVVALTIAFRFDQMVVRAEPAQVIAHRMGGVLAPENSLEGLDLAVSMGCYGAETDIQRTTDGHYVINHDGTFERLGGVSTGPTDMTLEQCAALRLVDPNFPDDEYGVATLEEVLDASVGHIKLFIELKGTSADTRMVDDVVRMVRERDVVDDVVLISSEMDVITYAETTYPEFETGMLSFTDFGDPSLLACDMLLMEEETASDEHIRQAHEAGKKAGVWTVNRKSDLEKVLNSRADYVITDRMDLAQETQGDLDSRNDLQVIVDWVLRFIQ